VEEFGEKLELNVFGLDIRCEINSDIVHMKNFWNILEKDPLMGGKLKCLIC
jgi:hypothetical protein